MGFNVCLSVVLPMLVLFVSTCSQAQNDVLDPVYKYLGSSHAASSIAKRQVGGPSSSDSGSTSNPALDAILNQIFNSDVTEATHRDLDSLLYDLFNRTASDNRGLRTCKTPEGKRGVCVNYYLCMNDSIVTDGTKLFDNRAVRRRRDAALPDGVTSSDARETSHRRRRQSDVASNDACPSFDHICCPPPDKEVGSSTTPRPASSQPVRQGCGWRNPQGIEVMTEENNQRDSDAKFAEFPWMVCVLRVEFIHKNKSSGPKSNLFAGGGSLIHPSVALTGAANFAAGPVQRVRAGEWHAANVAEPHPYQDRDVWSAVLHEKFNKDNLHYNVALLFLTEPMVMAPNVGLACLPPPQYLPPAGTRCVATGWGKDKFGKQGRFSVILKKVELALVDRDMCQTQLRKTRLGPFFELHSSFLCAGGERDKDTCRGDGGSPLACPTELQKDRYVQSGIVAWGLECGQPGIPGVYVDVASFREWIDAEVLKKGFDTSTYELSAYPTN